MNTVDEYMETIRPDFRKELQRIRNVVKREVPEAQEVISYGVPTFKYKGKSLLHYAAFKDHMSIFPTSQPIKELEDDLRKFKTAKGTLRFTLEQLVPDEIIIALVTVRRAEIDA